MSFTLGLVCQRNNNVPFLFEAAAANGFNLVLIHAPSEVPQIHMPAAVHTLELDIFTHPKTTLAKLEAEKIGLDGILTCREEAVPWTALAAQRLKLPGLNPEAAFAARDKAKMRKAFSVAGLNVPNYISLSPNEPVILPDSMSYPVVVKPTGGLSSQGVVRVDKASDLKNTVDKVRAINAKDLDVFTKSDNGSNWGAVIIEEYIDGPEYAVEVFAVDGRVHILSIGYKGEPEGPYFEETVYLTHPYFAPDTLKVIVEQVIGGMEALGISSGPGHCELRLRKGIKPYLLEIGARIGGSGVSQFIVQESSGIDYAGLQFRQSSKRPLPELPDIATPIATAGNWIIPLGGHGKLVNIEGLQAVHKHSETKRVLTFLKPGTDVQPYPIFTGYPGFVLSRHTNWQSGVDYHRWLSQTLRTHWMEVEN
jgi:hypothetical protein